MRRPILVATIGATFALAASALMGCYLDRQATAREPFAYCATDTECEALEPVLVGVGCEPGGRILVAREEDEFPGQCERIDAHWVRPLNVNLTTP